MENGTNEFLKASLWQQSKMSLLENELLCLWSESWRGWEGSSMMESSLFSDLLLLVDSDVSRFWLVTDPALRRSLLILLVSLALMLPPDLSFLRQIEPVHLLNMHTISYTTIVQLSFKWTRKFLLITDARGLGCGSTPQEVWYIKPCLGILALH